MTTGDRRRLPLAGTALHDPQPPTSRGERHLWMEETRFLRAVLRGALRGGLQGGVTRLLDEHMPANLPARLHLYLDNACGQACVFCEQPIQRRTTTGHALQAIVDLGKSLGADVVSTGVFDALLRAAARRTAPLRLEVTGNDWTRHPQRDRLLQRLAEERDVRVTLSGPSTALANEALARQVAALPTLEGVVLTLQSPDPARHDLCTGTAGSGAQVLRAIDHLQAFGVSLQVNTVLTWRAVKTLPGLLGFLAQRGLRSTLLTFLPDGQAGGAHAATVHPSMLDIRDAFERTPSAVLDVVERIEGLPPCGVPAMLRARLRPVWSTEHREPMLYGSRCDACASRGTCSGVVSSYLRAHGDSALRPI